MKLLEENDNSRLTIQIEKFTVSSTHLNNNILPISISIVMGLSYRNIKSTHCSSLLSN